MPALLPDCPGNPPGHIPFFQDYSEFPVVLFSPVFQYYDFPLFKISQQFLYGNALRFSTVFHNGDLSIAKSIAEALNKQYVRI